MRLTKYRTQLVKEYAINYAGEAPITSPANVRDILETMFNASSRVEEHVWQICINTKGQITGVFELATGSISSCNADVSGVLRNALLNGAYGTLIAHNHPSGDPTPSRDDIQVTKRMSQACDLVGVRFLDHVVIGANSYVSIKESGF